MKSRTHPRRRSRLSVLCVIFGIMLVGSLVVPAGSFSTANVSRGATFEVVADSEGSHKLDIAQSATLGQTNQLVTVTNNLGTDATIEIQLHSNATENGELVVDGETVGDEVSLSLPEGSSKAIDVTISPDSTLDGERLYFHVNASGPGLTVKAPNRYVPITA